MKRDYTDAKFKVVQPPRRAGRFNWVAWLAAAAFVGTLAVHAADNDSAEPFLPGAEQTSVH